jgi:hypothetical protein
MKIVIIAMARTGTSSLLLKLAAEHNLKWVSEPTKNGSDYLPNDKDDNTIVKIIMWHIPTGITDEMKWWVDLAGRFDKVVLLGRRDLKSCAESIAYLRYNRERTHLNGGMQYIWEPTPNYTEVQEMVNNYYTKLLELSKILKIDITYYEDIFDVNSPERLRHTHIDKRLI